MPRLAGAVACVLLLGAYAGCDSASPPRSSSSASAAQPAGLPPESRWQADVHAAMDGSRAYLDAQVDKAGGDAAGKKLAINLDIDNTSLATQYHFGAPVPDVLRFAQYAHSRGVAVLFNSARSVGDGHELQARQQLEQAGYVVDAVCLRRPQDAVVAGKQRCRRHFVDEGYTIVANIGNNTTDFTGGDYQRAFRLPNYGALS